MIIDKLAVLGGYDFQGDIKDIIKRLKDIRSIHKKQYVKIRVEYNEFDGDYTVVGIREKTKKDVDLELSSLKD